MLLLPDREATTPTFISGFVLGAIAALIGGAAVWRGLVMGVVRTDGGVVIRELVGTERYSATAIRSVELGRAEHDIVPLKMLFPTIHLVSGEEVEVRSLASYRMIPGTSRRAAAAVSRLTQWLSTD